MVHRFLLASGKDGYEIEGGCDWECLSVLIELGKLKLVCEDFQKPVSIVGEKVINTLPVNLRLVIHSVFCRHVLRSIWENSGLNTLP